MRQSAMSCASRWAAGGALVFLAGCAGNGERLSFGHFLQIVFYIGVIVASVGVAVLILRNNKD